MRKIVIEFELPEDIEADYSDIHAQLVFEDLFPSQIGFRIVSDTAQPALALDAPTAPINWCNPVNGVHAPFCDGTHTARQ